MLILYVIPFIQSTGSITIYCLFMLQTLREDVNRQTEREKLLQKKYSDLMYERDILASQIQSAEAERRK